MFEPPITDSDLATAEATIDRAGQEIQRLRVDNERLQGIVNRISATKSECSNSPSHVTPAMAVRILGRSRTYVDKLVLARKIETETVAGTKLIPMAEITRLLNSYGPKP